MRNPVSKTGLSLQEIEQSIADARLPPVQQWQPQREADMDMRICRDGSWLYQGSPVLRQRMVRLFSTILRLDDDGRYCLVTPVEKLYISVEDAPFLVVSMTHFNAMEPRSTVVFETNVGDKVILDHQHPLRVGQDESGHPKPYVMVRDGLSALLSRSVYYELAECCVERDGELGVMSCEHFHVLGNSAADERQ